MRRTDLQGGKVGTDETEREVGINQRPLSLKIIVKALLSASEWCNFEELGEFLLFLSLKGETSTLKSVSIKFTSISLC